MRLTADKAVVWSEKVAPPGVALEKVYLGPDPLRPRWLPGGCRDGDSAAVASGAARPVRCAKGQDADPARRGGRLTTARSTCSAPTRRRSRSSSPPSRRSVSSSPSSPSQMSWPRPSDSPASARRTTRRAFPGFTNSGLFATHHITSNVPKRSDWETLGSEAAPLLGLRRQAAHRGARISRRSPARTAPCCCRPAVTRRARSRYCSTTPSTSTPRPSASSSRQWRSVSRSPRGRRSRGSSFCARTRSACTRAATASASARRVRRRRSSRSTSRPSTRSTPHCCR